jgi:hypothetical protein
MFKNLLKSYESLLKEVNSDSDKKQDEINKFKETIIKFCQEKKIEFEVSKIWLDEIKNSIIDCKFDLTKYNSKILVNHMEKGYGKYFNTKTESFIEETLKNTNKKENIYFYKYFPVFLEKYRSCYYNNILYAEILSESYYKLIKNLFNCIIENVNLFKMLNDEAEIYIQKNKENFKPEAHKRTENYKNDNIKAYNIIASKNYYDKKINIKSDPELESALKEVLKSYSGIVEDDFNNVSLQQTNQLPSILYTNQFIHFYSRNNYNFNVYMNNYEKILNEMKSKNITLNNNSKENKKNECFNKTLNETILIINNTKGGYEESGKYGELGIYNLSNSNILFIIIILLIIILLYLIFIESNIKENRKYHIMKRHYRCYSYI